MSKIYRRDPILFHLHDNPRFEALADKIASAEVLVSLVKDGQNKPDLTSKLINSANFVAEPKRYRVGDRLTNNE